MRKALRDEQREKEAKGKRYSNKSKINIKIDKKKIIITAICIVSILVIIAINNYTSLGLVLNKNIDDSDTIQIELQTSNNIITPYGNEILVYNKGTITSYNNYGKQTGQIKLDDTVDAEIITAGQYIQVINKDKGTAYIYKNKYEVARIKIEGKIYSGSINSKGDSVIEYSTNGNRTELGVYDSAGNKKYNVKLSNRIIGKYTLSDNSKYLAYADVNVTGISAQTNINLIDLSNIKDGTASTNIIDTVDNGLVYDIYWSGKTMIARLEDKYVLFDTAFDKKEEKQIDAGQIVNIGDYDKKYAYTKLDENGRYVLVIRNILGEKNKEISIDDAPKYFRYENGIIYVCYAKGIEAYNNFGMRIKKYSSDMIVTEPIIFNAGKSVAMLVSNKLIIFTI